MATDFFALNRAETIAFLMKAVETLDDQSIKLATYTLVSSYRPWLLKEVLKQVTDKNGGEISLGPYVPPPRVRDAEQNWPYMRCKNVANALKDWVNPKPIPRSHYALIEYLARETNVSVETFKKTSPHELFKNDFRVMLSLR